VKTEGVGQAVNSVFGSNLEYADVETCRLNQTSLVLGTNQGDRTFMDVRAITQGGIRDNQTPESRVPSRHHDVAFPPGPGIPRPQSEYPFSDRSRSARASSELQLNPPRAPQPQPQRALFPQAILPSPFFPPTSPLPNQNTHLMMVGPRKRKQDLDEEEEELQALPSDESEEEEE
jgi:hypothetical protein